MARRARRTGGFWRGFLTGLALAAAATLGLAVAFPPVPPLPPEVDAGSTLPPPAPGAPERGAEPDRPRDAASGPQRAAVSPAATPPAGEAPPGLDAGPPPVPEVFDGAPALAPPAAD